MASNEWIHERFAALLGFSEDTSVEFILMIGKFICNGEMISYIYILQLGKQNTTMKFIKRLQTLDFQRLKKPAHLLITFSKNFLHTIDQNK